LFCQKFLGTLILCHFKLIPLYSILNPSSSLTSSTYSLTCWTHFNSLITSTSSLTCETHLHSIITSFIYRYIIKVSTWINLKWERFWILLWGKILLFKVIMLYLYYLNDQSWKPSVNGHYFVLEAFSQWTLFCFNYNIGLNRLFWLTTVSL